VNSDVSEGDAQAQVLDEADTDPNVAPSRLEAPTLEPYDPDPVRDQARKNITYWMLALLTTLFVAAFVSMFLLEPSPTFDQLKSLIEILLGPLVALVSAATGFYFGAQSVYRRSDAE
jgi:hypothetical protein